MTSPPVQIHLSDTTFRSRFAFEEAYILPRSNASKDAASIPRATLASSWLLGASDEQEDAPLEHIPLGWKCPLCGVVEVEKLYWRVFFRSTVETDKLLAAEKAAATGSKSNRRRLQKEKLRERRLAVKPFCENCYVCPRCASGSGSLGGLHMRLSTEEGTHALRYHVSCPWCQWHSYRSFPSIVSLMEYLAATDAYAPREDTLRSWRRAQREANDLLRGQYAPSVDVRAGRPQIEAGYSLSEAAWHKYVELLRPPQRIPGRQGQDGSLGAPQPRDVSFAASVGTPSALMEGTSPMPPLPGVPHLNLDLSAQGGAGGGAHAAARTHLREEEVRTFREIQQRGSMYTSSEGLHPAVALEKLRDLFEKQQLYTGKPPKELTSNKRTPMYVRTIPAGEVVRSGEDHLPNYPLDYDCEESHSRATTALVEGTGELAHSVTAHTSDVSSGEATMVGVAQAEQWGLHPLYTSTAPDVDELQRAMVPINAILNSATGGRLTASTRTGLRKETAVARGASAGGFQPPFTSPRPLTARNLGLDGPEAVLLEQLLTSPAHEGLLASMMSYYTQHPRKMRINALVKPLSADVDDESCANGQTHRFLLLDCDDRTDEDVTPLLAYWADRSALPLDDGGERELGATTTYKDDGIRQRLELVPGTMYHASRTLPCFQLVNDATKDSTGVEGPPQHSGGFVFRIVNLGTQAIVLRGMKIARRRLHGAGIQRFVLTVVDREVPVPVVDQPGTWVKLLPMCSPAEAAVAGFVDRGAAVLPPAIAEQCVGCAAAREVYLSLKLDSVRGPVSDSALRLFVGLELDVLTAMRPLPTRSGASSLPQQPADSLVWEYYQTTVGVCMVWS